MNYGAEITVFVACYFSILFGGIYVAHIFLKRWGIMECWSDGDGALYDTNYMCLITTLAYIFPGFLNLLHVPLWVVLETALGGHFFWWFLISPILWHLVPALLVGMSCWWYLKKRVKKLERYLGGSPPQTTDELATYARLVTDFPSLLEGVNRWRDPETGIDWGREFGSWSQCCVDVDKESAHIRFDVMIYDSSTQDTFSKRSVYVPIAEWRNLADCLLAGIRETGQEVREDHIRATRDKELREIRHAEEKWQAQQRELQETAALLEGRPRQVESAPPVAAMPPETEPPPAVIAPHAERQPQTHVQDLEGLGREL